MLIFKSLDRITPEILGKLNITALCLDLDNTLSLPHSPKPFDFVPQRLQSYRDAGINFILLSNNSDPRVKAFCEPLGLSYISRAAKPLPFSLLRAKRMMSVKRHECAVIGDQSLTDLLGAFFAGMRFIAVQPKEREKGFGFRLKRFIDRKIFGIHFTEEF